MKGFQNNLNIIKKWNDETIREECEFLITHSKYKNLDKIYNFTIQTYIKLRLLELNIDILNIENEYEYPNLEKFFHKCYINVSIWAWKNPFLFFKNNLKQIEIQNNYNIIEKNIKKIITNTLRECSNVLLQHGIFVKYSYEYSYSHCVRWHFTWWSQQH